jgi:hypothetical protein
MTVVFPDPPVGSHVRENGREYFLLASPYRRDGTVVPQGTLSDGASIPRLLWRVVGHPFDSRWLGPSVLHDWRYSIGRLPRQECDRLLREEMEMAGASAARAWVFYETVRLFGGSRYNKRGGAER